MRTHSGLLYFLALNRTYTKINGRDAKIKDSIKPVME